MDDQKDPGILDDSASELPEQAEPLEDTVGEIQTKAESPLKRHWPMIMVGVAMLLVGAILGYLGRGVYGPEATAAKATSSAVAAAIQTRASANKEVMTMLIGATRHFKGDANAPVTIIEFSDFQ
jgi:hypothetical protein